MFLLNMLYFIFWFQVIYNFRGGLHQVIIDDKESLRIPLKSKCLNCSILLREPNIAAMKGGIFKSDEEKVVVKRHFTVVLESRLPFF